MKEVTYEEWQKNPKPRMMWVWNDDFEESEKRKVVYVIKDDFVNCPVLAVSGEETSFCLWCHCAEIEEPKTRRMTNQELAWWLLEGIREGKLRQWRRINSDTIESVPCGYTSEYEDLFVENKLIRENGGEWHEPLVEVEK